VTATPSAFGRPVVSVGAAAPRVVVDEVLIEREQDCGSARRHVLQLAQGRHQTDRVVVGVVVVRRVVVGVVVATAGPPRPRVETLVNKGRARASDRQSDEPRPAEAGGSRERENEDERTLDRYTCRRRSACARR
jgi:hypothetical protein